MFKDNIKVLKENYPNLYLRIEDYVESKEYNLVKCRNESFTIVDSDGIYVHSRYNPEKEAQNWIEGLTVNEEDTLLIFGLGLGYYLPLLLTKYHDKKWIIVEPNISIFVRALHQHNLTEYLRSGDIVFLISLEPYVVRSVIDGFIQENKVKKVCTFKLPYYKRIYKNYIDEVQVQLSKQALLSRGNLITEKVSAPKWLYNTIRNLRYITKHPSINSLQKKFEGVPIVIVSAGPSLEKNMHLLNTLDDRALIIAVGSSVNILEKNGICPNIIMGIDGNEAESRIFENTHFTDPIFVYSKTIHYRALEGYEGKKLWMKLDVELPIYEELNVNTSTIKAGPSVANVALDFAFSLKPSQIFLIGQDLAYTNKKRYAKGDAHNNADHQIDDDQKAMQYLIKKDIYGKETYTRPDFITMKNWFEDYVAFHQKTNVYNCTEGGLEIKGIPNLVFNEAIELYCNNKYNIKEMCLEATSGPLEMKELQYEQFQEKASSQLNEAYDKSQARLEMVKELLDDYKSGNFQIKFIEIEEVTKEIESLEIYMVFIHPTGRRYLDSITTSTHNKLEDIECNYEKRRVLLKGLIKQYVYIHESIFISREAFAEREVNFK
ncbi:6-hydroxymethylpterin diphosphokinase MptE-like protein [Alkalihalobacillus sp. BA299]|uniref:motility associated factor glycosyltransferase family protein n=1 Tax=Alkalihalobacillus sp. BA299 TaxID=2815938 RepID=UPI001ADB5986|nr:6-hydroxymethylpterin diphosphokinase MptE-like protein [Alkalihalobacillus sp. BA299]